MKIYKWRKSGRMKKLKDEVLLTEDDGGLLANIAGLNGSSTSAGGGMKRRFTLFHPSTKTTTQQKPKRKSRHRRTRSNESDETISLTMSTDENSCYSADSSFDMTCVDPAGWAEDNTNARDHLVFDLKQVFLDRSSQQEKLDETFVESEKEAKAIMESDTGSGLSCILEEDSIDLSEDIASECYSEKVNGYKEDFDPFAPTVSIGGTTFLDGLRTDLATNSVAGSRHHLVFDLNQVFVDQPQLKIGNERGTEWENEAETKESDTESGLSFIAEENSIDLSEDKATNGIGFSKQLAPTISIDDMTYSDDSSTDLETNWMTLLREESLFEQRDVDLQVPGYFEDQGQQQRVEKKVARAILLDPSTMFETKANFESQAPVGRENVETRFEPLLTKELQTCSAEKAVTVEEMANPNHTSSEGMPDAYATSASESSDDSSEQSDTWTLPQKASRDKRSSKAKPFASERIPNAISIIATERAEELSEQSNMKSTHNLSHELVDNNSQALACEWTDFDNNWFI
eukprot:scaffold22565_cov97-Cylindrotheca_fusiformis.AAC.5